MSSTEAVFIKVVGWLDDVASTMVETSLLLFLALWILAVVSILATAAVATYVGTDRFDALLHRCIWLGVDGAGRRPTV